MLQTTFNFIKMQVSSLDLDNSAQWRREFLPPGAKVHMVPPLQTTTPILNALIKL